MATRLTASNATMRATKNGTKRTGKECGIDAPSGSAGNAKFKVKRIANMTSRTRFEDTDGLSRNTRDPSKSKAGFAQYAGISRRPKGMEGCRTDPLLSTMITRAALEDTAARIASGVFCALAATLLYTQLNAIRSGYLGPWPIWKNTDKRAGRDSIPSGELDKILANPFPDRLFTTNIKNKFRCHKVGS